MFIFFFASRDPEFGSPPESLPKLVVLVRASRGQPFLDLYRYFHNWLVFRALKIFSDEIHRSSQTDTASPWENHKVIAVSHTHIAFYLFPTFIFPKAHFADVFLNLHTGKQ